MRGWCRRRERERWSFELLAKEAVKRGIMKKIGREKVRGDDGLLWLIFLQALRYSCRPRRAVKRFGITVTPDIPCNHDGGSSDILSARKHHASKGST